MMAAVAKNQLREIPIGTGATGTRLEYDRLRRDER
jgi:hypothetical protein